MASNWTFVVDDLVWAKMQGYPPWPGRVSEPIKALQKTMKKNAKCIYFFGTDNYAWINNGCIKPYFEFKNSLSLTSAAKPFLTAVVAIEDYIHKRNEGQNYNRALGNDNRFENEVNNVALSPPCQNNEAPEIDVDKIVVNNVAPSPPAKKKVQKKSRIVSIVNKNDASMKPSTRKSTSTRPLMKKRKATKRIQLLKNYGRIQNENDIDPDKAFILSILPSFKKLDDHKKIDFRIHCLTYFKDKKN